MTAKLFQEPPLFVDILYALLIAPLILTMHIVNKKIDCIIINYQNVNAGNVMNIEEALWE